MSLTKTAEATRAVLKLHREEAVNGTLTVENVITLVQEVVPLAHREGIFRAIENYGPIGEDDLAWCRRAEGPRIPSWFYNPKTGEALA
jgi:hypothetical protein